MGIDTEQMPILDLTYASTFQDFKEATQAWSLNSGKGRRARFLLFVKYGYLTAVTWIVVGGAGLYAGSLPAIAEQHGIANLWVYAMPLFGGLIGGGAVLLFNPMMYRRRLRRIFRQGNFGLPGVTRFYPEGLIAIRKDGAMQTSLTWNSFEQWAESTGLFVLILSKIQYTWIPKRVLNPEQQKQLRDLLAAKIPADQGKA